MKQLVKQVTSEQIDTMIILKWHRMVYDPDSPSFVSYSTLGKAYGIDGSSVWRLILKRFAQLKNTKIQARRQRLIDAAPP